MTESQILIAVLEQQRNEAMSALAQAIVRGELLARRIAELEQGANEDGSSDKP